jgi:hypothetical protein
MSDMLTGVASGTPIESALKRILSEILEGLRHGHFEYTLCCELIGNGRRRLTLHAGKNHQFLIPADDCVSAAISR